MEHPSRIALLIDADNVSVDVLRQVLHRLIASGDRLQHRRAYGSVQKAVEFGEVCRDHAIRFLPSTFAGPNATDIAMAIDAVELVLRQPVDEVVIVSSDMDYSPLIVRLRELGCRVTGYGQQGKSGRDIERDYKDFNEVRTAFFGWLGLDPLPASTGIQARLCREDLLVEIEAIAGMPRGGRR